MSKRFLLENVNMETIGTGIFGDGGSVTVLAWGTFGGGTVFIEISDDAGVSYVPVTEAGGASLTFNVASSRLIAKLPSTQMIRATFFDSDGATGVNVTITS